jgi:hypothetical protein
MELVTDEEGSVTVTGFRGEYEAVVDGLRAEFRLGKDTSPCIVNVL